MKYLKLVLPIVLLFTLSCEPPTGPSKKKDGGESKNVSISITKPSSGSSFEQGDKIPCNVKISGDENLEDKIEWSLNNSDIECKDNEISLISSISAGDYTLEAYVDHESYNLSDEVNIEITHGPKAPYVEITLPQFDEFLYSESSNIYLNATADDANNNIPASAQIEWVVNGMTIATSSPGQEIKIEARPEYKKIVAKITDDTDLIGKDSLKIGVYDKVMSFISQETEHPRNKSIHLDSPISEEKHTVTLFKDINSSDEDKGQYYVSSFSFSPDNKHVAFLAEGSCKDHTSALYVARYDFSNAEEVYCHKKGVGKFSWLNEEQIAFISENKLSRQNGGFIWADYIFKANISTGETEKLNRKMCNEDETNIPCWSPFIGGTEIKPVSENEIIVGLKKAYETKLFEESDTIVKDRAKTLVKINTNTEDIKELWTDLPTIGSIRPKFADVNPNNKWVAGMSETYDEMSTPADNRVTLFRSDGSTGKIPKYVTSQEENNVWEIFFSSNNSVCFKEGSALTNSEPLERIIKCRDLNGNFLYDRNYSELPSISKIEIK